MSAPAHGAPPMKFSMPMFKDWVPEKIRPWIYVCFILTFQLTSGLYLGGLSEIVGDRSLMREDVLMGLYASLSGMAFAFPFLFRMKFRFTNQQLLLFASLGIAVLNVAALHLTSCLPVLWLVCFLTGYLKLQGTFECVSNIQLWISPTRDLRAFFPTLHLWILCAISLSDLLAVYLCYYATWHYMTYLMVGLMLLDALLFVVLLRPFRFMKPMPLLGIDWLGAVLWVLAFLQYAYIFTYGEFYNWWESPVIRQLTVTTTLTFLLAIVRMLFIRHPIIEPRMWMNRYLPAILFAMFVLEVLAATERVLEEVYYEAMEWEPITRVAMHWPVIAGSVAACLFSLWWLHRRHYGRVRLVAIGVGAFVVYLMCFDFMVSPELRMQMLYVPLFVRGFAIGVFSIVMLYSIGSVMDFMVFFQSLAIFQTIHLMLGGVVGSAIYSYGVRRLMADRIARYGGYIDSLALAPQEMPSRIAEVMNAFQISTVKQLYGLAIYFALALLLAIVLYDTPYMRDRVRRLPQWSTVGASLWRWLGR